MEEKLGSQVSLKVSDVELEKTESKREEDEFIFSNFPVWSSRMKCVLGYFCGTTTFASILMLCTAVREFGGSFATTLIPYVLCRTFVGTPVAFIEIMLGRFIMGNVARIGSMCPLNNAVFLCFVINTMVMIIWNNILFVCVLKYLVGTFQGILPWTKCDKAWSDIYCYDLGGNATAHIECIRKYSEDFCMNLTWEDSTIQYWRHVVGDSFYFPGYNSLYLFTIMAFIMLINCKGIRSLEKVFHNVLIGTLVLAAVFVIGSFHVPGEIHGLTNIWFFDPTLLAKPKVWIVSFQNCIFSTGLSNLSLSFISSHGKFLDDIFLDVLVVILCEVFYLVIMVIPISGIVWFMKFQWQYQTEHVFISDNIRTFIAMSGSLAEFPEPRAFWAGIFYTHVAWLTVGNQAILVMAISDAIYGVLDLESVFPHFFYFLCILGTALFTLSLLIMFIPINIMYPLSTSFITVVFLFLFTLNAFYGMQKYKSDFYFMLGYPPPMFFRFFWIASAPILLVFIILKLYYKIPDQPVTYIVYIYTGIPFSIYLTGVVIHIFAAYKRKNILSVFMANPNWGPDNNLLKRSRIILDSVAVTKEFLYRQELYTKLFIKPPDFTEQNIVQVI